MNALSSIRTNPTSYFFHQSQNASDEHKEEIDKFVNSLLDLQNCTLCRQSYNFSKRIPRILIHCGHTFCTSCLLQFYNNFRIRCPVCLKLIRNIEFIEQLPMNHTIMHQLSLEENKHNDEKINMEEILYTTFAQNSNSQPQQQIELLINQVPQDMIKQFMEQQIQLREQELQVLACRAQENPSFVGPINDPSLIIQQIQQQVAEKLKKQMVFRMEYCEYHYERYKHFHCIWHNVQCCRACCQSVHCKEECIIIDLYDVEDANYFIQQSTLLNAYNEVFNKLTSTGNLQEQEQQTQQQQQQQQQPMMNNFINHNIGNDDDDDIYEDEGSDSDEQQQKEKKLSV